MDKIDISSCINCGVVQDMSYALKVYKYVEQDNGTFSIHPDWPRSLDSQTTVWKCYICHEINIIKTGERK
jgi:hypothetical protein